MSSRDHDWPPAPYVLRGKVTEVIIKHWHYCEITVTDEVGFLHFIYVNWCEMPLSSVQVEGKAVTMWRATNRVWKYIAFDEYIAETSDGKKAVLDVMTQRHFDNYKRLADERLTINRRIGVIQEKVDMINVIHAESNAAVEAAKKTLTDYLTGQIAALRTEKKKYKLR